MSGCVAATFPKRSGARWKRKSAASKRNASVDPIGLRAYRLQAGHHHRPSEKILKHVPSFHRTAPRLYLIALAPPLDGFERFLGVWFYAGPPRVLVDVGPAATAPQLIAALEDIGARQIDYILLTHIHIDHAGGLGAVAAAFPEARVIVHSRGIAHLTNAEKLWVGSLKTLGATAEAYGPIQAIAEDRLTAAEDLNHPGITTILTPGHAPHHVSYQLDELLFAGEAAGVCLRADSGKDFMRPATPPQFRLETARRSIDALLSLRPGRIGYSHFGLRDDACERLRTHRDQLLRWQSVVADEAPRHPADQVVPACLQRLMREDPGLQAFAHLPAAIQRRESGFLQNSLRGFLGDFEANRDQGD